MNGSLFKHSCCKNSVILGRLKKFFSIARIIENYIYSRPSRYLIKPGKLSAVIVTEKICEKFLIGWKTFAAY